jgi:hypothetical protein
MKASQDLIVGNYTLDNKYITVDRRFSMVNKILELHAKKEYRPETAFIAISVADRYLSVLHKHQYPNLTVLAVISLLLAAKLEQHIKPNFKRMISMLDSKK